MTEGDPGTFAYLALALWVPISILAFFLMRPERATIFVLLGALLFLPEAVQVKLPYFPPLSKQKIPYLCVLFGALLRCPNRVLRLPRAPPAFVLAVDALGRLPADGVHVAWARAGAFLPRRRARRARRGGAPEDDSRNAVAGGGGDPSGHPRFVQEHRRGGLRDPRPRGDRLRRGALAADDGRRGPPGGRGLPAAAGGGPSSRCASTHNGRPARCPAPRVRPCFGRRPC